MRPLNRGIFACATSWWLNILSYNTAIAGNNFLMKIAYVHTWDVRAVAKGGVAVQLRYSECKCQKAKRRKGLVHIQRSLLVQNNAVKIGYVHTWNVRVQSLKAAWPCS
jgi:hypothetical protein